MFEDCKIESGPIEMGAPGEQTFLNIDWEVSVEQGVTISMCHGDDTVAFMAWLVESKVGRNSTTTILGSMPVPIKVELVSPFPIDGFVVTTRFAGIHTYSEPRYYSVGKVSKSVMEKVAERYPLLGRKLRI